MVGAGGEVSRHPFLDGGDVARPDHGIDQSVYRPVASRGQKDIVAGASRLGGERSRLFGGGGDSELDRSAFRLQA